MLNLIPLPVAVPLLIAAVLAGVGSMIPRRLADSVAIATAILATAVCAVLAVLAYHAQAPLVYWFGDWFPRNGVALGIAFVVDPFGAGLATLVAVLMTASLVYSWRYFDAVGTLFHALMLIFLAAMIGFCLSGDLFNLFVFFELMGAVAYALTGYKIEETGPLQGALNFGVVNSLGAFLALMGTAMVYGRTGALNLAQIGRALETQPADALVVLAFVLIATGFFVKGALVPFHFWLADAHAVAPTPVCVLFSGVMVELGLYGVARVYWTVFDGALGQHAFAVRDVLYAIALLTAVVGAVMCYAQHHVKRLLAYSTISHAGLFLVGVAALTPAGAAGAALYILSHGLVKGALFMGAGILLNRFGNVGELELQGRARQVPFAGAVFLIGGLALAGMPPFGTSVGKTVLDAAVQDTGLSWIPIVSIGTSILTGGAVLRVFGRTYLGWGERRSKETDAGPRGEEERESESPPGRTPLVMIVPPFVLLIAALILGLLPQLVTWAANAAALFQDHAVYASTVLDGSVGARVGSVQISVDIADELRSGLIATAGALLVAVVDLKGPHAVRHLFSWLDHPVMALRRLHSGYVGDYVIWLVVGVTLFGGALSALIVG